MDVDLDVDATARPIDPETAVPASEEPARCPHCGRPFAAASARDLHLGEVHAGECTDEERAAAEAADREERDALFVYHLKVVAALGVLYAGFVLGYMVLVQSF